MTNPEITKKMSTPRCPDGSASLLMWLMMTAITAIALRPSISGLYADLAVALTVIGNG
jgi:hypothetical protein